MTFASALILMGKKPAGGGSAPVGTWLFINSNGSVATGEVGRFGPSDPLFHVTDYNANSVPLAVWESLVGHYLAFEGPKGQYLPQTAVNSPTDWGGVACRIKGPTNTGILTDAADYGDIVTVYDLG